MAGKTKAQKKKRATTQKRLGEELRRKQKVVVADQPSEEKLDGSGERIMTPGEKAYIEDARKPGPVVIGESGTGRTAKEEFGVVPEEGFDALPEEEPFDPVSLIADILKKKRGE